MQEDHDEEIEKRSFWNLRQNQESYLKSEEYGLGIWIRNFLIGGVAMTFEDPSFRNQGGTGNCNEMHNQTRTFKSNCPP